MTIDLHHRVVHVTGAVRDSLADDPLGSRFEAREREDARTVRA
jgi:hypothetical protein